MLQDPFKLLWFLMQRYEYSFALVHVSCIFLRVYILTPGFSNSPSLIFKPYRCLLPRRQMIFVCLSSQPAWWWATRSLMNQCISWSLLSVAKLEICINFLRRLQAQVPSFRAIILAYPTCRFHFCCSCYVIY